MSAYRAPRRPGLPDLFQILAKQRPMMSLVERDILAASCKFVLDKSQWTRVWYDLENTVHSDCGQIIAFRAITIEGTLLWYVVRGDMDRGYHSGEIDPHAAIESAQQSWARRAQIRARWSDIEQIAKDLRRGRQKFEVRISDAHASPLCSFCIEGFVSSMGLTGFSRISGRMAALLMKIEPQMGFVIYEAWLRAQAEDTVTLSNKRSVPSGFELIS